MNDGGAENSLYKLLLSTKNDVENVVICFLNKGKYGHLIENENIKIFYLNQKRGRLKISFVFKLYSIIKKENPYAVQTWMYHADLLGGLLSKICGVKNIFWNIRSGEYGKDETSFSTKITIYLSAFFSYLIPSKIIINSKQSINIHRKYLYKNNFKLIYNGIDTNKFKSNSQNRNSLRLDLNIPKNTFVIGKVARFDPQKDHDNFVEILNILNKKNIDFISVLVGSNTKQLNTELNNKIKKYNLKNKIIKLGQLNNIEQIMNAFDLLILTSSYGESFPNVVAEAMSCEVISLSTNSGGVKEIINNDEFIIRKKNPYLFSKKIIELYNLFKENNKEWLIIKKRSRKIILQNFSISKMHFKYLDIWKI